MSNKTEYTTTSYTPVAETPEDLHRMDVERMNQITKGPHTRLKFPVPVVQTGTREISIPVLPVDYTMFDDAFEKMVHEQLGVTPGDEFLEEMTTLISRKLIISQIR